MQRLEHPVPPVYNRDSTILILGTFPSVKSREGEFFYHHPQNRFWKVLSIVFNDMFPKTIEEKKELLLRNRIALWDVIQSCEITGSADSTIKNVIPNDITQLLGKTKIERLYANGGKAYDLYQRYLLEATGCGIMKLPSTSPANASYSLERLVDHWKVIKGKESI